MKLNKISLVLAVMALSMNANSQTIDSSKTVSLNAVVVSVNKSADSLRTIPQQVQVLSGKDIENAQSLTTADLLSNAGISVQKSQQGGGSPVLRGFEANRIVLMIDGVRLNNLIYRGGHLQDIIKTDNSGLERVEVLYGPSSTIYGSDALGGVVHMYTKKVLLSDGEKLNIKVNALTRYESANNGLTEHLDFNIGGKKLGSMTSFTYSRFGDLMGGKNQNPFWGQNYGKRNFYVERINGKDSLVKNDNAFLQKGSAYSQYDLIQKFLFRQNDQVTHNINIQYSNSGNIPRYDRLTDPAGKGLKSSEWYYGAQSRMLAAYEMVVKKHISLFDEMHLGLNYQMLEESRHNRNFGNKFLSSRIENIGVLGANLDLQKNITTHVMRYGVDLQLNTLQSTAYKTNIIDNSVEKIDSRYPDGNNFMNNFAAFWSHTWKINNQLVWVDGIRVGYSTLNSTLIDTALMFHLPYITIEQKTPVYSGNIGIINNPADDLKLSFLLSTGFRVPNVDDMAKIFGSSKGNIIVPNPDLKPEKTINYEIGITKIFNNKTYWENFVYYTDFKDIAVLDYFKLNGKDSMIYDGAKSRILANQNKKAAYVYGVSSNLVSKMNEYFTFSAGINYTYGRLKTDTADYALDHIPPFVSRVSLKYTNKKFFSDFFIIYNGWKRLKDYYLKGEDNEQYATADGMPAWFTTNLRLSYQVHKTVSIQAGVDNLFDTQYRTFSSGINAPGRNAIIALRGSF